MRVVRVGTYGQHWAHRRKLKDLLCRLGLRIDAFVVKQIDETYEEYPVLLLVSIT
jgi:hypothetical protein